MFTLIITFDFSTKGEKGSRGDKGSQGEKGSQGQKGMQGTYDTKVIVLKHFFLIIILLRKPYLFNYCRLHTRVACVLFLKGEACLSERQGHDK